MCRPRPLTASDRDSDGWIRQRVVLPARQGVEDLADQSLLPADPLQVEHISGAPATAQPCTSNWIPVWACMLLAASSLAMTTPLDRIVRKPDPGRRRHYAAGRSRAGRIERKRDAELPPADTVTAGAGTPRHRAALLQQATLTWFSAFPGRNLVFPITSHACAAEQHRQLPPRVDRSFTELFDVMAPNGNDSKVIVL